MKNDTQQLINAYQIMTEAKVYGDGSIDFASMGGGISNPYVFHGSAWGTFEVDLGTYSGSDRSRWVHEASDMALSTTEDESEYEDLRNLIKTNLIKDLKSASDAFDKAIDKVMKKNKFKRMK